MDAGRAAVPSYLHAPLRLEYVVGQNEYQVDAAAHNLPQGLQLLPTRRKPGVQLIIMRPAMLARARQLMGMTAYATV
jgi:hypothetical protein